ncbi:hypothetical protein B0H34DRAFT_721914 [Crassisporium funariophilum]|nr:hypothetical protein B0H34DRAFT_721914 [Crassisporium funariophilum]
MFRTFLLLAVACATTVLGQVTIPVEGEYSQCGGIGYTGSTRCSPGWSCTYFNAYVSMCMPAESEVTTRVPIPTAEPTRR